MAQSSRSDSSPENGGPSPGFEQLSLAGVGAVVTGGAGGIGSATVDLLARRGASALAVDLDAAWTSSSRVTPPGVLAVSADITEAPGRAHVAAKAHEALPSIGVVVHAAGIGAFDASVENVTDAQWDAVFAVNVKAVAQLSQSLIPNFRPEGGAIVNVSSVHAQRTSSAVAPYAASKGAVEALTRSMAIDLAPLRIRVVSVAPGAIATRMLDEHAHRSGKSLEELGFSRDRSVMGRIAEPDEVAEVIAFLASEAASAINGSHVTVDAGLLAAF